MPRIVVEKSTDFEDEDGNLRKGSWSVDTQPLRSRTNPEQDKAESKYDMEDYTSKYNKRIVDPKDNTKTPLIDKIINIGISNDKKYTTNVKKDLYGQPGRNETTWMMDLTPESL